MREAVAAELLMGPLAPELEALEVVLTVVKAQYLQMPLLTRVAAVAEEANQGVLVLQQVTAAPALLSSSTP